MFQKILTRGITVDEAIDVLGVKVTGGKSKAQALFDNVKSKKGKTFKAQRALVKGKRTGKIGKFKKSSTSAG